MSGIAIDYATVGEALGRAGVSLGLAELHGGLCGTLCGGGLEAGAAWLEECLRPCDARSAVLDEVREELSRLQTETWEALLGSQMAFKPLGPDDEDGLEERVQALALWCHGFLVGLGFSGVGLEPDDETGSKHLEEVVGDFSEIARAEIGTEEEHDWDQAGFALAELTEYVRVGVQIVFEELEAARAPRQPAARSFH